MTTDKTTWIESYLAARNGAPVTTDRYVETASGMSHEDMHETLADPAIAERGLEVIADFMAPEGSLYYDAIFGKYHGQKAIREWLIPAMQEITFIDFEPRADSVFMDDGQGGTTIDEWQMVANMNGMKIPLSRGVSVRKYRDGWIRSAVDVYDTMAFRMGPPPDMELPEGTPEPAPLPDPPAVDWPTSSAPTDGHLSDKARSWAKSRRTARQESETNDTPTGLTSRDLHDLIHHPETGWDFHLMADMMHPTEAVYIDPIFGEFKGQADIRAWLTDIMSKVGNIAFDPVGPVLFDGDVSLQEWVQVAVTPDGTRVPMTRGTSVRKYRDGWVVYSADYFDAATMMNPEVQQAAIAAGSTITAEDIARYRPLPMG